MTTDTLTLRALNRATLERQLLLRPAAMPAIDAVQHLVGLQAQIPLNPYLGLWSRLDRFRADDLSQLVLDRSVVRIVVMRGTLHLVTADDCLVLRPLVQPVLDRELANHRDVAPGLVGVDLAPVLKYGREVLAEPRSGTELRAAMAERFPALDAAALAYACRNHLALVQPPPRGVWGRTGQVRLVTAESFLGRPVDPNPSIDDVVLRYFAAFGPASAADVSTWSGLPAMREVIDRLGPALRPFVDGRGRELFDLPDAPRPDPATPAPPRLLPEYDNVMLSHADRTRFVSEENRARIWVGDRAVHGSVLSDGLGVGTWRIETDRATQQAILTIDHVPRLSKRARAAIAAEGRRALRFLEPDAAERDVRLVALD